LSMLTALTLFSAVGASRAFFVLIGPGAPAV